MFSVLVGIVRYFVTYYHNRLENGAKPVKVKESSCLVKGIIRQITVTWQNVAIARLQFGG
jgi:hypothetical protein